MSIENKLRVYRDFGVVGIEMKAPSIERFFASIGKVETMENYIRQGYFGAPRLSGRSASTEHYTRYLPFEGEGSDFSKFYMPEAPVNIFGYEDEDTRDKRLNTQFAVEKWFVGSDCSVINLFFLQFVGIGNGVNMRFRGLYNDDVIKKIAETLRLTFDSIIKLTKPCEVNFSVEEEVEQTLVEINL